VGRFERWLEAPKAGYRVQLACIEGIVSTAAPEHSAAFLARAIAREPRGGLLSRLDLRVSGIGTIVALLNGAYYAPSCTDELAAAVRRWLGYPQRSVAALAHAALRRHGVTAPDPPERVRDELRRTERFLRGHGSSYGLMSGCPPGRAWPGG
jgi:hypothetical protein